MEEIERLTNELLKLKIINEVKIFPRFFHDEPYIHTVEASPYGFGRDFFDVNLATRKALSEAVERTLWIHEDVFYKNKAFTSSYENLIGSKINIFDIAGFTPEQRAKHVHLQFNEDTLFSWIPVKSLVSEMTIYCPTALLSIKHVNESKEPMLAWSVSTGQACAPTVEGATLKAILELIERDAFMITYMNKLTPPELDLASYAKKNPRIAEILNTFERFALKVSVVSLPTDFRVSVFMAIITDSTEKGPAVSVGASCGFDEFECIEHALSEALVARYYVKDKMNSNLDPHKFNFHERMVYWSKLENANKLKFLFGGEKKVYSNTSEKVAPTDLHDKLHLLLTTFKQDDNELCFLESTIPAVTKLGLRSVIVYSPNMQPMHMDESIPSYGGKRMRTIPLKLGYTTSTTMNTIPHPFP